jgi:hypothetical protein
MDGGLTAASWISPPLYLRTAVFLSNQPGPPQVEFATLGWVDWFNHRRLMGPIGNIPPAEAEQRYYASLESPALVA